jgi:hypothetical protein
MRPPVLPILAAILGFGLALPAVRGLAYLDSILLLAISGLSLAFSPGLSLFFLQNRPALNAIGLGASSANLIAVLTIGNGLFVANVLNWLGQAYLPPIPFLIALWIANLGTNLFTAALTVVLAIRQSPRFALVAGRLLFFLYTALVLFLNTQLDRSDLDDRAYTLATAFLGSVSILATALLLRFLAKPTNSTAG